MLIHANRHLPSTLAPSKWYVENGIQLSQHVNYFINETNLG